MGSLKMMLKKIVIAGVIAAGVGAQEASEEECVRRLEEECLAPVSPICDAVDETGDVARCCAAMAEFFNCFDALGEAGCEEEDVPESVWPTIEQMSNDLAMHCGECGMGLNECLAPVGPICDNVDATGDLPGCCEIIRYSLSCVDGLGELGCERGDIPDDAAEGMSEMESVLSMYCDECALGASQCLGSIGESCDNIEDDASTVTACCEALNTSMECLGELDDPSCLMPGGELAEDVARVYGAQQGMCRVGEMESCDYMPCRDGLMCDCGGDGADRRRNRHLNFGSMPGGNCVCKER